MAPSRVFLGTAEPFPQLVAKRILHGISGLPDLGNIIITVPGTFASAALQESLAANAQYGLLMPQIITPGILLHNQEKSFNLPGQLENELIWNRVATSAAASGNFDLLFPHVTDGKGCSGSSFSRLRIELAAGGLQGVCLHFSGGQRSCLVGKQNIHTACRFNANRLAHQHLIAQHFANVGGKHHCNHHR